MDWKLYDMGCFDGGICGEEGGNDITASFSIGSGVAFDMTADSQLEFQHDFYSCSLAISLLFLTGCISYY